MKTPRVLYRLDITTTHRIPDRSVMVLAHGTAKNWTLFTEQYHGWAEPSTADNVYRFVDQLKDNAEYDMLIELSGKIYYTLRSEEVYL
jgi:hypothetical protein